NTYETRLRVRSHPAHERALTLDGEPGPRDAAGCRNLTRPGRDAVRTLVEPLTAILRPEQQVASVPISPTNYGRFTDERRPSMKIGTLAAVATLCLVLAVAAAWAQTSSTTAPKTAAKPAAKPAATAPSTAAKPAMDAQAMQDMMMKMAAPGPNHEVFKKLAGEWNCTVKSMMDPSKPPEGTKSTSVVTTLMDGRYSQEQVTGTMMGQPFSGLGLTGYDNMQKMYVSSWIDNMGTGIMLSKGTADATGKVINWTSEMPDPTTGKTA